MARKTLPRLFLLLACLCVPGRACALGPVGIEIAALGGGGGNPVDGISNPLGGGIGGRVGATFRRIYAGARVDYYFGGAGWNSGLMGGELGYGITLLDFLTLRPQLGVGQFQLVMGAGPVCCTPSVAQRSALYLQPGVLAMAKFSLFFVGVDANILLMPAGPVLMQSGQPGAPVLHSAGSSAFDVALTGHLQLGVAF